MDFLDYLTAPYKAYSTLQIVLESSAVFFGILSVYFSYKNKIWVFPTGIISTAIFVYLLFQWQLYGDLIINSYYFIMSIVGWYIWTQVIDSKPEKSISRWTKKEQFISLQIFISSIIGVTLVYYFRPVINSNFDFNQTPNFNFTIVDYIDILNTAIFFIGMWLMAQRKIENWIFWIIGDFITVPLYLIKDNGYPLTAFQYIIFTIFAFYGLKNWIKIYNKNKV